MDVITLRQLVACYGYRVAKMVTIGKTHVRMTITGDGREHTFTEPGTVGGVGMHGVEVVVNPVRDECCPVSDDLVKFVVSFMVHMPDLTLPIEMR